MKRSVLSEEDFESSLPSGGRASSPSVSLGSHLPNPLNLALNIKKVQGGCAPNIIQPIGKVPSGVPVPGGATNLTGKKVPSTMKAGASLSVPSDRRDRINNVTQKEEAMSSAGVTRNKTYTVILKLLSAQRWTDVTDVAGNVRRELVDDLDKQRAGAELALKAFGDMIEHKQVEYGIADSTLAALKKLSVAELRGRAASLLAGRTRAVDVAAGLSGRVEEGEVVPSQEVAG